MGNPTEKNKTRPKNQAHTVQISTAFTGSGIAGSSRGGDDTILTIPLNKLNTAVVEKAQLNTSVVLRLQSDRYEVYWKDDRLGTVPDSYTSTLSPKSEYRGRVIEASADGNPIVIIEVRITRNQS